MGQEIVPERTVYKYIKFVPIMLVGYKWACLNNKSGSVLGLVGKEWRRPAFIPKPDTVFSADCLLDIVDFLEQVEQRFDDRVEYHFELRK